MGKTKLTAGSRDSHSVDINRGHEMVYLIGKIKKKLIVFECERYTGRAVQSGTLTNCAFKIM